MRVRHLQEGNGIAGAHAIGRGNRYVGSLTTIRRRSISDAEAVIACGEGYARGADVVHQQPRDWHPGQHGPQCVCDYCVTGHALRDQFFHEVIEIINEADGTPSAQKAREPGVAG